MGDMRPFPMGKGPPIPWFMAEAIYKHLYRQNQPLEQIARRGGFSWAEVAWMWENPRWHTTPEQRAACAAEIRHALTDPAPNQDAETPEPGLAEGGLRAGEYTATHTGPLTAEQLHDTQPGGKAEP